MQFFESVEGSLYPTSDIERVYRERSGKEIIRWVELKNGQRERLVAGEFENLRRANAPFTAAEPGHFVLRVDFENQANDPVYQVPVIGWLVCPETGPSPVTLEGVNDGQNDVPPVLFPDGKIHEPYGGLYQTIDEFIEAKRKV